MLTKLSTNTIVRAIRLSDDWDEQQAMLDVIKHRRDLFNVEPILEIAVDADQHAAVRRKAVECAGTHNLEFVLDWLQRRACRRTVSARVRSLALDALAQLQMPHKTLDVFHAIAENIDAREVRVEAIRLIGVICNLRSVGMLMSLERDRDRTIADAARDARDNIVERNGGKRGTSDKMLNFAQGLRRKRLRHEAVSVLNVAKRLDPYNGRVHYELASL